MQHTKVYVEVVASFREDGLLLPKEIIWEDGRHFEIDGEINPSLTNFNMCHLYRYEDGKIRKSTEEELRAEYDFFEIVIPEEQPIINIEELKAEISDELLYNFQEGIEDLTICQLETMYQLDLMWMGLM